MSTDIEDKWSLIFIIVVPLIELVRLMLIYYGGDKAMYKVRNMMLDVISTRFPFTVFAKLHHNGDAPCCPRIPCPRAPSSLCRRKKDKKDRPSDPEIRPLLRITVDPELGLADQQRPESRERSNNILPLPHLDSGQTHRRFPNPADSQNTSSPQKGHSTDKKDGHQLKRVDMKSLNTYDAFKVFSTITMFLDHYSYFGLPGLSQIQSSWFRIFGRSAAPGFFFLAGYSSKKFRTRTWFTALFVYLFIAVIPLAFVHSPWESIMNVMLINCVLFYVPPHRITSRLVHVMAFVVIQYYRRQWSRDFNIGYGTLPFAFAIAGDLVRHKHELAPVWVLAAITSFASASIEVFAKDSAQTVVIVGECMFNAAVMIMFRVKEIKGLNEFAITRFARDGMKWLSRSGLVVYIGHLGVFRLAQLCYYSGGFRHLIY